MPPITNEAQAVSLHSVMGGVPDSERELITRPILTEFNGQKLDHLRAPDHPVIVRHSDVEFVQVDAKGFWRQDNVTPMGTTAYNCDFGSLTKVEDTYTHSLQDDLGAACSRIGDCLLDHVAFYGFIDLWHPGWGEMILHHFLMGPLYHDLSSRHQGRDPDGSFADAHCDPVQNWPSSPAFGSLLMQVIKFQAWTMETGAVWDAVGRCDIQPATSGLLNLKGSGCRNVTLDRFWLEGNYFQSYLQDDGSGPPLDVAVMDGIIKRSCDRPNYGVHRIMNLGPAKGGSRSATLKWARVRDADTGELIDPRDFGGTGGGTVLDAGPRSSYPMYTSPIDDGGTPPPPNGNGGTTPMPSTITAPVDDEVVTGLYEFKGSPGDDPSDYFFIRMRKPDGTVDLLDKDKAATISETVDTTAHPQGRYAVWLEGEQSGTVSAEVLFWMHEADTAPEETREVPLSVLQSVDAKLANTQQSAESARVGGLSARDEAAAARHEIAPYLT